MACKATENESNECLFITKGLHRVTLQAERRGELYLKDDVAQWRVSMSMSDRRTMRRETDEAINTLRRGNGNEP